jgi:hypothetical protein
LLKRAEDRAWREVQPYKPTKGEVASLRSFIGDLFESGDDAIRAAASGAETLPQSNKILNKMLAYSKFKKKEPVNPALTGKAKKAAEKSASRGAMSLSDFRRELQIYRAKANAAAKAGKSREDIKTASRLISIFDDWVYDNLDNFAMDEVEKYLKARSLSAAIRKRLGPTGNNDVGGKWLKDLIEKDNLSAEKVVTDLTRNIKAHKYVDKLKEVLGPKSPAMGLVKLTYIDDFLKDKSGNWLNPSKMIKRFKAMKKNRQVYEHLFDQQERMKIEQAMKAIEKLERPGRSGITGRAEDVLLDMSRFLLRRKGTHETFQARSFRGGLWHSAARLLGKGPGTSMLGGGVMAARRARMHARGDIPVRKFTKHNIPTALGAKLGASEMESP